MTVEKPQDAAPAANESRASAEHLVGVFDHVKLIWDDQVDYAATLREKRRNTSTLLAILIGLGVFRLEIHQKPAGALIMTGMQLSLFRWALLVAVICFAFGIYFLYTERPNARRLVHWILHTAIRWAHYLFRKAFAASTHERASVKREAPPESPWPTGRAIAAMLRDDEHLQDWFQLSEDSLIRTRTERLRAAYLRLVAQNKRVAVRLRASVVCLLLGYLAIFVVFVLYIMAITE